MARIDCLLFGYRRFSVSDENVKALANALLRCGINAKIKPDGSAEVRLSDSSKLASELNGRIEYTESKTLGLPGFFIRNRYKYGTLLGIFIGTFILIYSSGHVWDVRVTGVEDELSSEVALAFEDVGLRAGMRWRDVDTEELEAAILRSSDKISWVNINRRGTVAYVSVREKNSFSNNKDIALYSNVVAECDAVIEEVKVKKGYAVVKPGDVVRKGDLLISGIIPGELGGGFCRAEGEVIGHLEKRVSVQIEKETEQKVYLSEKRIGSSYKILGFSINIFKNSRNLPKSCDIIEYKREILLFGKFKLPLLRTERVAAVYEVRCKSYSTDELIMRASEALESKIRAELSDAELLKIRTLGEFTDSGYIMYSDALISKNIGCTREIVTEE